MTRLKVKLILGQEPDTTRTSSIALCVFSFEARLKSVTSPQGLYNSSQQRYFRSDEEVIVPIIENAAFESDLTYAMVGRHAAIPAVQRGPGQEARDLCVGGHVAAGEGQVSVWQP